MATSEVVQMPLESLTVLVAMRLRTVCDPIPQGINAAAALLAQAVYAICADAPGDVATMTREDAMIWTSIVADGMTATAQGLYEAHFGDKA